MVSKLFSLIALAASAHAHIKMALPVPYDEANTNNFPVDASGSNFPCKNPNYNNVGTLNKYEIGGPGQLQFIGSAVHGGGSCQVSITYDNPPTAESAWKVIQSYEGGCPARNTAGNLGDDSAYVNPNTYDFTIPAIPTGEATLAVTWINKVGNREFYMMCAPIEISGSGGSAETYAGLPDMLVVNIPSVGTCTSEDSTDVEYPDPGEAVEKLNGSTDAFAAPLNCPSTSRTYATPTAGSGSGSGSETTSAAVSPTTAAAAVQVTGGVFITKTGAAAGGSPTTTFASVAATSKKASQATTTSAAGSSTSGSGSGSAQSGACSTEGVFNCIGANSFQQCASGQWSAVMPLAAGTKCDVGISANFVVKAA